MSFAPSIQSTATSKIGGMKCDTFQDPPFVDKATKLTVIELKSSDQQLVNELVYRWCRKLTRDRMPQTPMLENRRVLIIDLTSSISLTRLAVVLKEDYARMNMIEMVRGCKINSTYITLSSYLGSHGNLPKSIQLVVIYQDEFYIHKTLSLLKDCLQMMKCKVLLVVPKLDRSERDILNLISNYQILRCDFHTKRRGIGPALGANHEAYQMTLNRVYFQRSPQNIMVEANLKADGLHKYENKDQPEPKRFKADLNQSI